MTNNKKSKKRKEAKKEAKTKEAEAEIDELEEKVRPHKLDEMIGQEIPRSDLKDLINGARKENSVIGHILLEGPSGTGKTTLGKAIAVELGVQILYITGVQIEKEEQIYSLLKTLKRGDILFIDEIHMLSKKIKVILYPAMEFFKYPHTKKTAGKTFLSDDPLKHFIVIGATTDVKRLEKPYLRRFRNIIRTEIYTNEEIGAIIKRSAKILKRKITDEAVNEIALRAKFNPDRANNILDRVLKHASSIGAEEATLPIAEETFKLMGLRKLGLESIDEQYLDVLVEQGGGPLGIDGLAAYLGESIKYVTENIEPFLNRIRFIKKNKDGEIINWKCYRLFGFKIERFGKNENGNDGSKIYTGSF